jgi:hypothetical protein
VVLSQEVLLPAGEDHQDNAEDEERDVVEHKVSSSPLELLGLEHYTESNFYVTLHDELKDRVPA